MGRKQVQPLSVIELVVAGHGLTLLPLQAKWSDGSSVVREFKRATFTLNRSAYTELLSTIRDGVSSLESLTTMNIDLEPKRRARSHVRFLSILRGLSSSMYRAVRSSLACACKHKVLMRLSTWPAEITPADEDEEIIQDLKFRMALSSESVRPTQAEPQALTGGLHSWEEIFLQASPASRAAANPAAMPALSRAISDCPARSQKKRGKTVNFASFRSSTTAAEAAIPLQRETTFISNAMSKMTLEVTSVALSSFGSSLDLCGELRKVATEQKAECYGVVFDPEPTPTTRSYAVYPVPGVMCDISEGWRVVSLRDVLEGKGGLNPLGYRHRLQLAVFIARSVLQFYKTPWLPETPSSRNVFFLLRGNSMFSYYEHAFVMAESGNTITDSSVLPIIRSPTLLALGILLIELVQNKTIDSLRTPDEAVGGSGAHSLLSDYMTARRLLGEVYQTSSNYGSAVRRCIDGEFSIQKLDLEDEDFRQEVYSGVVALLEEDLSRA